MSTLQTLLSRQKAVNNTKRLMEAMKLMATNKVKRTEQGLKSLRQKERDFCTLLQGFPFFEHGAAFGPLMSKLLPRHAQPFPDISAATLSKKGPVLLVVLGADKGLCAGFHSQLTKAALTWSEKIPSAHVYVWGTRTASSLKKTTFPVFQHQPLGRTTWSQRAFQTWQDLENIFSPDKKNAKSLHTRHTPPPSFSHVLFVHHHYHNALRQTVKIQSLADVMRDTWVQALGALSPSVAPHPTDSAFSSSLARPTERRTVRTEAEAAEWFSQSNLLAEPSPFLFLKSYVHCFLHMCLHRLFFESTLCEESARMTAMDAAVRNSDDLLEEMSLVYNRTRQAMITKELIEVVSGGDHA